jgi:coenzyme F420-reducing hydrogenase delta subunit
LNRAFAGPLKLYVYYCSGSFDFPVFGSKLRGEPGDELKFIGLPCSGKMDILYLVKSFETGADGVVLLTCAESKCRYLEGNLRAPRRLEEVNSILEESGVESGRVLRLSAGDGSIDDIVSEINIFFRRLRNMTFDNPELKISEPVMAR